MPTGPLAGEGERKGGRSGRLLYLHAGLGQVDLHGQLFPGEDVRVVSLGEDRLQRLQLRGDKQRRRAGLPGGPPTDPGPTAAPAGRTERAGTCWSVKVVRFRRCFRRRKPSSKSAVEGPPKAVAPEPGERAGQREPRGAPDRLQGSSLGGTPLAPAGKPRLSRLAPLGRGGRAEIAREGSPSSTKLSREDLLRARRAALRPRRGGQSSAKGSQ